MNNANDDLADLAKRARAKMAASGAGTMHAMWDTVFDAEALASGKQAILDERTVRGLLLEFLDDDKKAAG